jgi:predicted transcriptional regulator
VKSGVSLYPTSSSFEKDARHYARHLVSAMTSGSQKSFQQSPQTPNKAAQLTTASHRSCNRRLGMLEGIARGERAIEEGRVVTHAEAKKSMSRWLK